MEGPLELGADVLEGREAFPAVAAAEFLGKVGKRKLVKPRKRVGKVRKLIEKRLKKGWKTSKNIKNTSKKQRRTPKKHQNHTKNTTHHPTKFHNVL